MVYENKEFEVFGKKTNFPADLSIPEPLRTIRVLPTFGGGEIHTIELKGQNE